MNYQLLPEFTEPALCAEVDPELFFPEKGGSTLAPKRICDRCAARDECLNFALDHRQRFGVWGAASERERRRLALERGIRWDDDPDDYRPWDDEYPEIAS